MEKVESIQEEVARVEATLAKVTVAKVRKVRGGRALRITFGDGSFGDIDGADLRALHDDNGLR